MRDMLLGMIRCITACLVLLVPFLLSAQDPPHFSAADKSDVEKLINGYFQSFSDKDYARVRESFGAPFLVIGNRGSLMARSLEDTAESYRMLRESLSGSDYSLSKVAEMRITALAGDRALADLHWQRLKKDGSIHSEGAEVMLVSKSSGSWKIYASIPQNLADFGKIY